MWNKFTVLDALLAAYFLLLFAPRWLGFIIGALLLFRILKDFLPPSDKIVFDLRGKRPRR